MNASEIYASSVRQLSRSAQLELVRLIVHGLTSRIDQSDEWSDEDIADMTAASMRYALATENDDTNALEWLEEAKALQEAIRIRRGDLPDSTPDISEDRRR